MLSLGFTALPCVLWRKQTNAPNKFMGSGMLPAGAYVTLEHEYILVLRKGPKRAFRSEIEKKTRRESAIFWEERNSWFSDVWFDIKGTPQALNDKEVRKRSGAYPFELVYRLINMYSARGDTVLDPFFGTGTTMAASMASCRNSMGYEIDPALKDSVDRIKDTIVAASKKIIRQRLMKHVDFVIKRRGEGGGFKYASSHYGFPVITNQEKMLLFNDPESTCESDSGVFEIQYADGPQEEFCRDWSTILGENDPGSTLEDLRNGRSEKTLTQKQLF
jgi:modification methylase